MRPRWTDDVATHSFRIATRQSANIDVKYVVVGEVFREASQCY